MVQMVQLPNGVRVCYSQFYVMAADSEEQPLFEESFYGQLNALCGARTGTSLFLITGLNMGRVPVEVEFSSDVPSLSAQWEEVVESSLKLPGRMLTVLGWGGESVHQVSVPNSGNYRVRYCATGMDAGRQSGALVDVEDAPDRYLLQFWPGPVADDEILRQTSEVARTAHANIGRVRPP